MSIAHTRAMVRAALSGDLLSVKTNPDPVFGLLVPATVPGVPAEVLNPRSTWADPSAYDAKARDLAGRFKKNFEQFASAVSATVRDAGPA